VYAEKLTLHPDQMGAEDVERLRAAGLDDRAIHDATQVVGYFNYINRVADALGIEPETFISPWGCQWHRDLLLSASST
jgi:alkylhydroperoxidase family enzyme